MRILVTGSAGYLGKRICRHLKNQDFEVIGFDQDASEDTTIVGGLQDDNRLKEALKGVAVVIHVAGYHRPYLDHRKVTERKLIETNIVGTLNVLETMSKMGITNIVFTSTTAVYGLSRAPTTLPDGTQVATVISEKTAPRPDGPYGVSKLAAEQLCEFYHKHNNLNVVILRPSRFFPDADVDENTKMLNSHNLKANEFLHRRVDIRDLVKAYSLAVSMVDSLKFDLLLISARTPLLDCDLKAQMTDAPSVVEACFPGCSDLYQLKGWSLFKKVEFIYSTSKAMQVLGYQPQYNFEYHLGREFEELKVDNESPPWRRKPVLEIRDECN